MAERVLRTKTSVSRVATSSPPDASTYARDLNDWPRSWMGLDKDIPPGEGLVACFRPFIEHLAASKFSPKTIRRHVDNLWMVGGEIIRKLNYDSALRKMPAEQLLRKVIDEEGGPLVRNASEEEQRSVDSTCRKLHRFLSEPRN